MTERFVEVLACYGAVMAILFLINRQSADSFYTMAIGWSAFVWIPGIAYILVGTAIFG